ncbi:hypothetical protein SODALDRAFT_282720 [Sodiomyces alkalinus F11]|uniref:Frequency clock protein n=1 Tax=Sodiomyces alkalinus (strain CBS 110278 / VKM F-3762 / F11) TaxID=1314773 RepID=A0A3N2PMR5_SODAK|nr:hypothetical protein SODALDRAFT_282720 [Sodiomyces alkalinus F11]ROT35813.1 hypothetical protein SODALDRAFT_282720 [Sodiomyces alkalinus F11]
MTDKDQNKLHGAQPPSETPLPLSTTGHTLPRRTLYEKSVTLQHHRLARDAAAKATAERTPSVKGDKDKGSIGSPCRKDSAESRETGQSDAMQWFDQSNQNPTVSYSGAMEVDPPFYQKESDSSNEDAPQATYPLHLRPGVSTSAAAPVVTRSSSTDDYRSVIDDLTVEIQKLKEELKRYKQLGPDMLKKEKLFEIKMHGLPKRKKRELEATLRDFAASISESPSAQTSSGPRKKSSRHASRLYSRSGSMSKHASSSSGSQSRPVDSAYASMSTGHNSSGTSMGRPSVSSQARSAEQKVQSYLKDIPEGLYPRHVAMTDRQKKKLVVRRLEQLFTGKTRARSRQLSQVGPAVPAVPQAVGSSLAPVMGEVMARTAVMVDQPASLGPSELTREAPILLVGAGDSGKQGRSRDYMSMDHSNSYQTYSRGSGAAAGDAHMSPPNASLPEQRPTRPLDLDPDRVQNPSENMDYIRHLGLIPPELLPESSTRDVAPDADGWVYLNLLCNLAQLHIINVTPDFVRVAISEKSTKFQLSADGRKIRWRGGTEGTKFSSDSSGDNSGKSPSTDDTDGSNENDERKKRKTVQVQPGSADDFTSAYSSKNRISSHSFHYKPLFVHQAQSAEQTSADETGSSLGPAEESNMEESRWGNSGSGSSQRQRRKRRLDGAIIYYSGAPFCTDLSGDPGDSSPTTYLTSSGRDPQAGFSSSPSGEFVRPDPPQRTSSGSVLRIRPLSDGRPFFVDAMNADPEMVLPGHDPLSGTGDFDMECPWSDVEQPIRLQTLESSGLGGVVPEDHFMILVKTRRPKNAPSAKVPLQRPSSDEMSDAIIYRFASMSPSPRPIATTRQTSSAAVPTIKMEYVSGGIKRLSPVALPPPAVFIPPFSTDTSVDSMDSLESDDEEDESESSDEFGRKLSIPRTSDIPYPDNDMSSGDEEGGEPDDEDEPKARGPTRQGLGIALPPRQLARRTSSSAIAAPGTVRGRSKSMSVDLPRQTDSSNATDNDDDVESGYSSGREGSS